MIRKAIRADAKSISTISKLNGGKLSQQEVLLLLKSDTVIVIEDKEIVVGFCIFYKFPLILKVFHWGFHPEFDTKQDFIDMVDFLIGKAKHENLEILVPDDKLDIHLGLKGVGFKGAISAKDNSVYLFTYESKAERYVA